MSGRSGQTATRSSAPPGLVRRTGERWSMDDLGSELIGLIFQELRDIDAQSLATCRLLSRRFNTILTPIKYEHVRLTERITHPESHTSFPQALQDMYTHTRHVDASSDLDPQRVRCLLDGLQQLLSVRWHYTRPDLSSGPFWVPLDAVSPRHMQAGRTRPRLRLSIQGLPLRDFSGTSEQDSYLKAIPANLLVSLKVAIPSPPLTTRLESLKQLLLKSPQLEVFHLDDRGQGSCFSLERDERLPAFRELVLRSYDWNHSAEEVESHWNMSRIRVLKLVDVPMLPFLRSVDLGQLARLERLRCEDFSTHLPDRHREATQSLYTLVRQHIRALDCLKITCHTDLFPVDGLLAHAASLRVLRFRDHVGFGDENRRCPTLWVEDLARLSRALTRLVTLELDMDVALCDPPLFLRAVCTFPRLRKLTLHVHTVLHADEAVHPGTDRDRDAALTMLHFLVANKAHRAPNPALVVPWRRITVNVGGWTKHLVRRLDLDWRRQNERGVYAERCFVLDVARGVSGADMTIREVKAVER